MNKQQKSFMVLFIMLFLVTMTGQFFNMYHLSESYHDFADTRTFVGLARFSDVVSNIGFLIVGLLCVKEIFFHGQQRINLLLVAIGSVLVFFGSSYYHLLPEDSRLLWDRLPISVVFSGILCHSLETNNLIFFPWKKWFGLGYLTFSLLSVIFWYVASLYGKIFLGPYVFVQFGGIVMLIAIGLMGTNKTFNKKIFAVLSLYIIAKVFEYYDGQIFEFTKETLSGHTLKHIVAAIGLYVWFPKENENKIN